MILPTNIRSSHPEVLLGKGVLKLSCKFTGEHPYRSAISINFIEITLRDGCSTVNLLHIVRTPFLNPLIHKIVRHTLIILQYLQNLCVNILGHYALKGYEHLSGRLHLKYTSLREQSKKQERLQLKPWPKFWKRHSKIYQQRDKIHKRTKQKNSASRLYVNALCT